MRQEGERLAGSKGSWNVVAASWQCCQVTDIVVAVAVVVNAVVVIVVNVAVAAFVLVLLCRATASKSLQI